MAKLPKNTKWVEAMCNLFPDEILEKSKLCDVCKLFKETKKAE